MTYRKKLIEVALPLEAINRQAARENYIYKGNPSSIHKWWAQRPLAACRAVVFASIVDDPSSRPEEFPTDEAQQAERERLFRIIEELVKWENSNNERVLEMAQEEIRKATNGNPPPVLDPFCGGGSIPLEAQRLGLETYASDLNPVAVLITKALIEIPPKFANQRPVNRESRAKMGHSGTWKGAQGLAEDVRCYASWMRDEAERRIGHLYPKVKLSKEHGGGEATVIAWLWARTVKCPNPACGAQMPLMRSFWLSTKAKKKAWVEPIVNVDSKTIRLEVRTGEGTPREGTVNRRGAECLVCQTPVPFGYIRAEGRADRMSFQLTAIAAEGPQGRVYVSASDDHEVVARSARPEGAPETNLPDQALGFRVQLYGMTKHRDLFTPRQLVALTTFSNLAIEVRDHARLDAEAADCDSGDEPLEVGGKGARAYAEAIATYLAFVIDKVAEYNCTLVPWYTKEDRPKGLFARQAIPMVWDFAEVNPLARIGGTLDASARIVADAIPQGWVANRPAYVSQLDARSIMPAVEKPLVCTDPPYYANIGYADLADFFFVWLRRSLRDSFPNLFSTLLTPKEPELVATPYRFEGNRGAADDFFEEGLSKAFELICRQQSSEFPTTVFYAYKQEEEDSDKDQSFFASTGWETLLEAIMHAGFSVNGTWPMRTERGSRSVGLGTNALASSVVLVCRPAQRGASLATRREFLTAMKAEMPAALKTLQQGGIAPVDLAQAAIGPGMAVYSRYAKVLEADGSRMSVRTSLGLINQVLDEVLGEQESEYDSPTRWALAWFEQYGTEEGDYGGAETLSKAKNVALSRLVEDGFLWSRRGKVRLLRREELAREWDPAADSRITVWEATQHLVGALERDGERGAAALLRKLGWYGEAARDLAYRLYSMCERKKWSQEALAYNAFVASWPELAKLAAEVPRDVQASLGI
jgi:putative DNA methylase